MVFSNCALRRFFSRQLLLERTNPTAMRGYNPIVPAADPAAFVPEAAGVIRPRSDAAASGVKVRGTCCISCLAAPPGFFPCVISGLVSFSCHAVAEPDIR